MIQLMARGIWSQFVEPLRNIADFNTGGSLYGRQTTRVETWGRLEIHPGLLKAEANETLEYVVYSYKTPIAWRIGGTWTETAELYSMTTTKHQRAIGTAISVLSDSSY